ncbi:hypothetical protein GCM10010470_59320 [Saccharopolyspora taberi]|uniref:Uncharacterized protein n=1 Tax=Saccharopolyspora taberi TaxID=60895 RepID=A0ABN3VL54_9PSEU
MRPSSSMSTTASRIIEQFGSQGSTSGAWRRKAIGMPRILPDPSHAERTRGQPHGGSCRDHEREDQDEGDEVGGTVENSWWHNSRIGFGGRVHLG